MRIKNKLVQIFSSFRVLKYRLLSTNSGVGKPSVYHPLMLAGQGTITFGNSVQIGAIASPGFYSGYTYIEARNPGSSIIIGNNVAINNCFSAVAFSQIIIDDNVLIGTNCSIADTDGHFLQPEKRNDASPPTAPVHIGENVFLGSNVVVLKGVNIGKNSVIGNNSVVTKSIPDNVIAAGNPARVIKSL
ncbi:MAG: acyltransferase [Flavobacterium sp.]|nr:MAG: acyltransferase [Flavobacterium sp.]